MPFTRLGSLNCPSFVFRLVHCGDQRIHACYAAYSGALGRQIHDGI
jgi:hypothetical protein